MTATVSYHTAETDVEALEVGTCGWAVVEAKFQELRALLSAPTTGLNASQAREDQKRAVSAAITRLLDRAQAECRRLLVSGNAKAAVEGGLKTLKLKEEYYGPGSLQLVPAYFHLARTNQFMDKFKRAEEFLSLAQYEVLRHPDADISLHAELHQTFGLLYASDGKLDAALKQLTCSTYYLSCMHGPEHVLTSFGYFDVGNVFAAKSHMEHAMAFYDRVKKIWDAYLTENLQKSLDAESDGGETPATLGDENVQDAAKMLRGIVGLQTERYGQIHPAPAYGEHVLGMFLLWSGDSAGGFETLLRALEIYKRVVGERHPQCQGIRLLLVNHGFQVPEDTADALADDGAATETGGPSGAAAIDEAPPQQHQQYDEPPQHEMQPPPREDAAEVVQQPPPADVVSAAPLGVAEAPQEPPAAAAAADDEDAAPPASEPPAAEEPATGAPPEEPPTASEEPAAADAGGDESTAAAIADSAPPADEAAASAPAEDAAPSASPPEATEDAAPAAESAGDAEAGAGAEATATNDSAPAEEAANDGGPTAEGEAPPQEDPAAVAAL
eukprot:CAMPEP_0174853778 /NCGR_PEP_ID=MMETSP1114-20130205/29566_1 /TAXON_ID=312471 /ORGANISM="Neobodo designis, Strain CCAP 1951/1" /LENGTH=555 /DNA_ID=CAMNT_0016088445 /DNA_START=66 /DNA_END=1733 /DNA_ORIENTATION=-